MYLLTTLPVKATSGSCWGVVSCGLDVGAVGQAIHRKYNAAIFLHKAGDANRAALFHAVKGGMRVAKAQKFLQIEWTLADVYEREARIGLCDFFDLGAVGTSRHNVDFHRA